MGVFSHSTEFNFDVPKNILFRACLDSLRYVSSIGSYEGFELQNIIVANTKMKFMKFGERIEIKFEVIDDLNTKIIISSGGPQFEFHQNKDNCDKIIYSLKRTLSSPKYKNLIEKEITSYSKDQTSKDPHGELLKLKKLLDVGIISEEEYESQKIKLLSQLL